MKRYTSIFATLLSIFAAACLCCCTPEPIPNPGNHENGQQTQTPDPTPDPDPDPDPNPDPTPDPDPDTGTRIDPTHNVWGYVSCEGKGVANVVVSDGYQVAVTDERGLYSFTSGKRHGYVFISVPAGYEVPSKGVQPQFYAYFRADSNTTERFDFELKAVDQSAYRMLFFGDMHLANRSTFKDLVQFEHFTAEVHNLLDDSRVPTYALTLGDMSWDIFWINNKYDLTSYLDAINGELGDCLQIFHTMGNHDNDPLSAGDFDCEAAYKRIIGPTFYSFNIGGVHYVVLDDIFCRNDGAGTRSYYANITSDQGEWLVRDLKHVSKSTPVVITMHAPLYRKDASISVSNGYRDLISLLDGYNTTVVTGHTHVLYNVDKTSSSVSVYEANSGAVCGGWWVTWSNTGIHLGGDGAPGGYRIMDVEGKTWRWMFKGTERSEKEQFRSYDRNTIELSAAKWTPSATSSAKAEFESTVGSYRNPSSANEVLVNVWDWDPSWKVEMSENGKALSVTRLTDVKDPLYLVCYEAYQFNHGWGISYPAYTTDHMFRARASSATSTIEIKVTDRYGRIYTESMKRPKVFSVATYK